MNRIFKVGGVVRDALLGQVSKDVDFAVECESFDAMRQHILNKSGKIFLETPDKFTIRANIPVLGSADFVLCRKDGPYSDGRRPDFVEPGTILDDLARRDFTMNAIAIDCETGEMLDPHDGQKDIKEKVIRAVGNPWKRLAEDRLRILRAVRFAVTKHFVLDGPLFYAIKEIVEHEGMDAFQSTSTERIREELFKMFAADTVASIRWLDNFQLIDLLKDRGIWLRPTLEKP